MKSTRMLFAVLTVLGLLRHSRVFAELKMPAIFSDNMVLQRDRPIPVWGWADAGATSPWNSPGRRRSAKAESDVTAHRKAPARRRSTAGLPSGRWIVKLDPMRACCEPQGMTITSSAGNQKLEIRDILVGDVWLCSGQSNMEMPVGFVSWSGGCLNYEEEIKSSTNPLVREYTAAHRINSDPKIGEGKWFSADTATTGNFSATGYFFAREIQKRLKIPVAILNASVGATPIEAWISRERLLSDPEIADLAAKQAEDATVGAARRRAQYLAEHAAWRQKYARVDPGTPADGHAMAAASADTSDWKTVTLPGPCGKVGCRHGGILWLRREIELPPGEADRLWITLPIVKDLFTVYFNGVKLYASSMENGYGRMLYAVRLPKEPHPDRQKRPGRSGCSRSSATAASMAIPSISAFRKATSGARKAFRSPASGAAKPSWNMLLSRAAPIRNPGWRRNRGVLSLHVGLVRSHDHSARAVFDQGSALVPGRTQLRPPVPVPEAPEDDDRRLARCVGAWATFPSTSVNCQTTAPCWKSRGKATGPNSGRPRPWRSSCPTRGLANLIDTCEDGDLHPRNKQEVGRRLALVAMANTYGDPSVICYGPMYESMQVEDGKAVIRFHHADGGLAAKKTACDVQGQSAKAGAGRETFGTCRSPTANSRVLRSAGQAASGSGPMRRSTDRPLSSGPTNCRKPVAVRYAWADHPVCNLYNKAGLPAFPFRTDEFRRIEGLLK